MPFPRSRRFWRWAALSLAALILWIAVDLTLPVHHDLRDFDGREVGRLEASMWRSYYDHHPVRLFTQMTELLRRQYRLPVWRSYLCAFRATRAAVIFQRGHNRTGYLLALPDLRQYYRLIQESSVQKFDVDQAAGLELEWWIVHRERALHPPGDLVRALADLQAVIYAKPVTAFEEHAKARAAAMELRDAAATRGGPTDAEWRQISNLLIRSWVSLRESAN